VVRPEGNRQRKARPQADAVLLMTFGINRSEWNEEMVSPEGIDNGKARPWADAVLLMSSGIDRSEWNEEW
jgi:hypothetical protein